MEFLFGQLKNIWFFAFDFADLEPRKILIRLRQLSFLVNFFLSGRYKKIIDSLRFRTKSILHFLSQLKEIGDLYLLFELLPFDLKILFKENLPP